jgi:aspartyl-tRNA(Asn)/glutamyl-tRNA(Gln) amidotransferase subunit C
MARITREEVERVAALARISLSDSEVAQLSLELDTILEYAQSLQELDTAGVDPTSHAIPLPTPLRDDVPVAPMDAKLAVSNAPERSGTAFVVPKVIDEEDAG